MKLSGSLDPYKVPVVLAKPAPDKAAHPAGPVFIHAGWRNGASYFWQKLADRQGLSLHGDWQADFPSSWRFASYHLDKGTPAPALFDYFDRLMAQDRLLGRRSVFVLIDHPLRSQWLRQTFAGTHIRLHRQPRRQFISCMNQNAQGDFSYLERLWLILGQNRELPELAPLYGLMTGPGFTDHDTAHWHTLAKDAAPADHFLIFRALYHLAQLDQQGDFDLSIDLDGLHGTPKALPALQRSLKKLLGCTLDLSDLYPYRHAAVVSGTDQTFSSLEAMADRLLLHLHDPLPVPDLIALLETLRQSGFPLYCARLCQDLLGQGLPMPPALKADLHIQAARAQKMLLRLADAEASLRQAAELAPDVRAIDMELGEVLHTLRRPKDAEQCYRAVLRDDPGIALAHNELGLCLLDQGRHQEAIEEFHQAAALAPDFFHPRHNLGHTLLLSQRPREAVAMFRVALKLEPDNPETLHSCGGALVELGQIDEGRAMLERAIALKPDRPLFYRALSELKRFQPDDPHLQALLTLATKSQTLWIEDRINLHFTLGKALDDMQRYPEAFDHLFIANRLHRQQIDYDEAAALSQMRRIAESFDAESLRDENCLGDPSQRPLFIVGMPRSGSTLVEQILASHPQIFGAGEVSYLSLAVDALGLVFPEQAAQLTAEQARKAAGDYLAQTSKDAPPQALRITDKMLLNFHLIGMIRKLFPNARILHRHRNPLDT